MEENRFGRRIYYDNRTGHVIHDTGEMTGFGFNRLTIEQETESILSLKNYDQAFVGVAELAYGEYVQDFLECIGYAVNPQTGDIQFTYGDRPEEQRTSLSKQVEELKEQNRLLMDTVNMLLFGEI